MKDAVHAEWTKLRTSPGTSWLLLTAIALTIGLSTLASWVQKCPASCDADITKTSLTGILLGQAVIAGFAVAVITSEYSSGMIRITLTAMPRRWQVLAAKGVVITAPIIAAGIVAVLGSLLAGRILEPGNGYTAARGFQALSLSHGPTFRAAAGSVLYLVLVGLLSLGIASALRDTAATLAVVLGFMYVLPAIGLVALSPTWQHRIERWTPMDAGLAIQATKDLAKQPIGPWPGIGVLAAWTAAALAVGYLLLRLRDA
jgi:ABC-2 type transport system permease protein